MIVVLLRDYQQLRQGAEGIIYDSADGGWLAVFGSVVVTLLFEGEGVTYKFI